MDLRLKNKFILAFNAVLNNTVKEDIDDTLLQKFISHLKDSIGPNGMLEDILEESQLLILLRERLLSTRLESVSLTFAIQTVNVLILHLETLDPSSRRDELLHLVTSATPVISSVLTESKNPSATVAALECLISLQNGINWSTDCFLEPVQHLLTDKSYFVQKNAQRFLANYLRKCWTLQCDAVKTEKFILEPMRAESEEPRLLLGTLEVLLTATKENDGDVVASFLKRNEWIFGALLCLLEQEGRCAEKSCELLAFFLGLSSNAGKWDNKDIIEHLLKCDEPVLLMKFLYFCLKNDSRIDPNSSHLCILFSPLAGKATANDQLNSICKKLLDGVLSDKSSSKKLLMSSLSFLCKLVSQLHPTSHLKLLQMLRQTVPLHSNCRKTLTLLVQLHHKILHHEEVELDSTELMKSLETLQIVFSSSAVTASIFNQTMQTILQLLRLWSSSGADLWQTQPLTSLADTLNRKLVDRQWEIIDSTLEFLTNVLDISHSEDWICTHKLHSAMWSIVCIPGCDGYVKASAIKALLEMCRKKKTWERLVADEHLSMTGLFSLLLQYVQDDTDVFVQRAAATAMHQLSDHRSPELYVGLCWSCCCSLDWELKLTALKTWKKVEEEELTLDSPVDEIVKTFYVKGFLSSLVSTLEDCERTVRLLSAEIALHFRESLEGRGFKPISGPITIEKGSNGDCRINPNTNITSACNVSTQNRSEIMEDVLNMGTREYLNEIIRPTDECEVPVPKIVKITDTSCEALLAHIWELDLPALIKQNTISTDVYAVNFEALVDDLLSAVEESNSMESQVIDCY